LDHQRIVFSGVFVTVQNLVAIGAVSFNILHIRLENAYLCSQNGGCANPPAKTRGILTKRHQIFVRHGGNISGVKARIHVAIFPSVNNNNNNKHICIAP